MRDSVTEMDERGQEPANEDQPVLRASAHRLADNWNAVVDFTTASHPTTIHDTTNAITGTTRDPAACQTRQAHPAGAFTTDEDQRKRRL